MPCPRDTSRDKTIPVIPSSLISLLATYTSISFNDSFGKRRFKLDRVVGFGGEGIWDGRFGDYTVGLLGYIYSGNQSVTSRG